MIGKSVLVSSGDVLNIYRKSSKLFFELYFNLIFAGPLCTSMRTLKVRQKGLTHYYHRQSRRLRR